MDPKKNMMVFFNAWLQLPENPDFDDIGFVGWQGRLMSAEQGKQADIALAEIIRKHWEAKEKKSAKFADMEQ